MGLMSLCNGNHKQNILTIVDKSESKTEYITRSVDLGIKV